MNHDLLARLVALAPEDCRIQLRPIAPTDLALLTAEETALIPSAGELRRREFATGRAMLRELLPGSGSIGRAPTGAPLLPHGRVGSLAHDRVAALAVVGPSDRFVALGIDLEHLGPDSADDELRDAVLRTDDAELHPTAAFVIKEAAYKAYSALGGPMLGPLEVRVEVTDETFRAHFPAAGGLAAHTIDGVFVGDDDCCSALAVVRR